MSIDFFYQIRDANSDFSLVVEADDRAAYGYLLERQDFVADVWLFNCQPTPDQFIVFRDGRAPLNSKEFVSTEPFDPRLLADQVSARWRYDGVRMVGVEIYLRERLHGFLKPGSKPGWCILAAKDGPVALALRDGSI